MAQVGQKSETWKQKRANMRASVSMRGGGVHATTSALTHARVGPRKLSALLSARTTLELRVRALRLTLCLRAMPYGMPA